MWYQKIVQVFKIRDLRKKIFFVLAMMAVFRLMANIPVPGIDTENLKRFFEQEQSQMFGLLNIFVGGTLSNLSIVMLGLGPYITAVIIMQLLTLIFPQLERMYKEEGEQGRQKFNQYGRVLTVPLAALQSYGMLMFLQGQGAIGSLTPFLLLSSVVTVTAGTMFLMWIGELISEKGIGNGVSLLIFAGIVARAPSDIRQTIVKWDPSKFPTYLLFFLMALVIIAGVVMINEARRNIPVSYAKRIRGMKMYGGVSTYLPLNINPAGVIPIIFALAILFFPSMVANFLGGTGGVVGSIAKNVAVFFQNNSWVYGISYFILVFLFTYFYTAVTFDPKAISANLQKMGGFIPGIRPGKSTADFLFYILHRVLFVGALFLGIIAIMPLIVQEVTDIHQFTFLIGGTSLLIIVAVVLETVQQIKAQLQMREYENF
ncbi:preprotein translocase subunit SecY [bacterium]|nr:preprotein translocase subunit SecY [bacterium]